MRKTEASYSFRQAKVIGPKLVGRMFEIGLQ
jgi:hypothetical protein